MGSATYSPDGGLVLLAVTWACSGQCYWARSSCGWSPTPARGGLWRRRVVLPYVGTLVVGLWSTAVLMRVFEEVDGIGKMKAFVLAFGVGVLFWIPTFLLLDRKSTRLNSSHRL